MDSTEIDSGAAERPDPNTRAPEAGSPPAAGRISPAEKAEPSGVPVQEQRHNADPNAPQRHVVPPGETDRSDAVGGIPVSSTLPLPDLGTEEARREAQVPKIPPPEDAGAGTSIQENDPNVEHPRH